MAYSIRLALAASVGLVLSCKGNGVSVKGPFGIDKRPSNTTCVAFPRPMGANVGFARVWPDVTFNAPVALRQAPGDKSRFYVLEQAGKVQVIGADGGSSPSEALDITDRVNYGGEAGLLGIAFHPQFAQNGKLYLYYTADGAVQGAALQEHISEFLSKDGGKTFDKTTERILVKIDDPYTNHNGGNLLFGPDGFLYFGVGDGGSGGDPDGNGQKLTTLMGKMNRIDVDKKDAGKEYAIPADNPFADGKSGSPEIFAWGLRNPWRWSFDRMTGKLWCGDVGQNMWEEIDIVERGKNYGWNAKEGTHCYTAATCNNPDFVEPLAEHSHSEASSITGGYVYRGKAIPSLVGQYVYGDFESGNLWHFLADGKAQTPIKMASSIGNISSFGEDEDGELYVVLYSGVINRLTVGTGGNDDAMVPKTLTATGCVSTTDAKTPAAGLIPYGVNSPLWSDGAEKSRWMALPDGATITIKDDGDFDFPNGTVLVKEFRVGGKRIETRLMVHHTDGEWAGYTYEWRSDESDADLLPGSKMKSVGNGQTWTYPSRTDCLRCHTEAAGFSLGPEVGQLNGSYAYPSGTTANQLETLHHIGVLTLTSSVSKLVAYPSPTDSKAPLADRARAYLHSNCSQCHRAGGSTPVAMDLRYAEAFGDTGTCGTTPSAGDLGVTGAKIITPGMPAQSVLSLRLHATSSSQMPPLARSIVDTDGVGVIDSWITSLTGCTP